MGLVFPWWGSAVQGSTLHRGRTYWRDLCVSVPNRVLFWESHDFYGSTGGATFVATVAERVLFGFLFLRAMPGVSWCYGICSGRRTSAEHEYWPKFC